MKVFKLFIMTTDRENYIVPVILRFLMNGAL